MGGGNRAGNDEALKEGADMMKTRWRISPRQRSVLHSQVGVTCSELLSKSRTLPVRTTWTRSSRSRRAKRRLLKKELLRRQARAAGSCWGGVKKQPLVVVQLVVVQLVVVQLVVVLPA